eukprot:XP_017454915.1 PREDICTED: uncharacterized protein LOC103693723 [Rattus norvegicus]
MPEKKNEHRKLLSHTHSHAQKTHKQDRKPGQLSKGCGKEKESNTQSIMKPKVKTLQKHRYCGVRFVLPLSCWVCCPCPVGCAAPLLLGVLPLSCWVCCPSPVGCAAPLLLGVLPLSCWVCCPCPVGCAAPLLLGVLPLSCWVSPVGCAAPLLLGVSCWVCCPSPVGCAAPLPLGVLPLSCWVCCPSPVGCAAPLPLGVLPLSCWVCCPSPVGCLLLCSAFPYVRLCPRSHSLCRWLSARGSLWIGVGVGCTSHCWDPVCSRPVYAAATSEFTCVSVLLFLGGLVCLVSSVPLTLTVSLLPPPQNSLNPED